ncbi:MAG: hypothetical protein J7M18_01640 [Candidatus Eremiobacteraeota bacterium]|nr:hypothetical protein [Candidatus Eremiobacteraeota bacterium]
MDHGEKKIDRVRKRLQVEKACFVGDCCRRTKANLEYIKQKGVEELEICHVYNWRERYIPGHVFMCFLTHMVEQKLKLRFAKLPKKRCETLLKL